jgi:hypothetical protein
MAIDAEHLAFLRSYIQGDDEACTAALGQISEPEGLGMLLHGSFVIAVRRRFAPSWTRADVVRYVADVRARLIERTGLLDPQVAEHELRRALGDTTVPTHSAASTAPVQLILLTALVVSLGLDETGVDGLLSQVRQVAPRTGVDESIVPLRALLEADFSTYQRLHAELDPNHRRGRSWL